MSGLFSGLFGDNIVGAMDLLEDFEAGEIFFT
ncbi:hypothetical protein LCGC14_2522850, partial [marine sediment metagenome]